MSNSDIRATVRRRLQEFQAHTVDPRWSSHSLDALYSLIRAEGGSVNDLLVPLYSVIAKAHLSAELANFIKDVSIRAFSTFQENYQTNALEWMAGNVERGCTPPQAYLALYAIPQTLLTPECIVRILKSLAGSRFWSEAVSNLEPEAKHERLRSLLMEWLDSGIDAEHRPDVERLLLSAGRSDPASSD